MGESTTAAELEKNLMQVWNEAKPRIEQAPNQAALDELRVHYLGRKGRLTEVLRTLGTLSPDERTRIGKVANELKEQITVLLDERQKGLKEREEQERIERERVDWTLPGRRRRQGHMHVLNHVLEEVVDIFAEMGFKVATGPEVETEYYNFDALNTPEDHPARDSHDTFYIRKGVVLRTHTTPVQIRVMEQYAPPVAVVMPGRVYRVDFDASHSPMFNQLDGLLVDENVTFSDLKGTLLHFVHRFFGPHTRLRFRPHFFPFTEPSAEVDISCSVCKGAGCRLCKNSGWLEILGCGMCHPKVFERVNYDYEKYSGYAFGFGIDRLAMLRYSIPTIGLLFENNLAVLEQF